jgi:hypothetical protein
MIDNIFLCAISFMIYSKFSNIFAAAANFTILEALSRLSFRIIRPFVCLVSRFGLLNSRTLCVTTRNSQQFSILTNFLGLK